MANINVSRTEHVEAAFAALLAEYDALIAEELRAAESMLIVAGKDPDEIDSTLAGGTRGQRRCPLRVRLPLPHGNHRQPDMLRTIDDARRRFRTTAESIRAGTLVNVTDGEEAN